MKGDIDSFYNTELRPVVDGMEQERKAIRKKLIQYLFIPIGIFILLAPIIAFYTEAGFFILIVIPLSVIAGVYFYKKITNPYVDTFKRTVISELVSYVNSDLKYDPHDYISEYEFKESRLYEHRIDKYNGEDLINGMVGKTAIKFSEILAKYKTETHTKDGTKTQWHTLFDGLFFVADFNKKFSSDLIVKPDFAEKLFGRFGQKFQKMNVFQHGELISLEDPDFEKEFKVYGTDQTEARYILTPGLMEKILKLNNEILSKEDERISLSFINSKIYLALPLDRDLFEPKIFSSSVVDKGDIVDFYEYIQLMVGIVEDLDLNARIWTKK